MTGLALLAGLLAAAAGGLGWLTLALTTGTVQPNVERLRGSQVHARLRPLLLAALAALATLALTRWLVLAVAVGALVATWPLLFGAARAQQQQIARLEALASWIEALRDTIATGLALPEAVAVTSRQSPVLLRRPLADLTARMGAREPLDLALLQLADDLDDPVADQTVAALALNARTQGRALKQVLSSLAVSTRQQVDARQHVEADRRSVRQATRIIMLATAAVVIGLGSLNRTYVQPFDTVEGQVVLAFALGCFAAGFLWLHRLSRFTAPARFLSNPREPRPVRGAPAWQVRS